MAADEAAPPLVITGATGWLGRAALARAVSRRRVAAFASKATTLHIGGRTHEVRPLETLIGADVEGAVVLHFAALTKDTVPVHGEEAFAATSRRIDDLVLEAIRDASPAGVFVASSGAALVASEPYGQAKRLQELRFGETCNASGVPAVVCRLWSLAGPHINKPAAYALANFITQATEIGRIHIRASTPTYRSYVHVYDLLDAIAPALQRQHSAAGPIDIAGSEIVEMADVADAVAEQVGLSLNTVTREKIDFSRRDVYVGDPAPFRELLLAQGKRPTAFSVQISDTLKFLTGGG